MRILNIHGYHGSTQNSLYKALAMSGYGVISEDIDYDSMSPEIILGFLKAKCVEERVDAVAGTSLGGFFALLVSTVLDIPVLVVNPALVPDYQLPRIPDCRVCYGYLKEYFFLGSKLRGVDLRLTSTIIGTADEVIDNTAYTEFVLGNSRFIKVPGGKHSGSTLNLPKIIQERGSEFFNDTLRKDLYGFSAPLMLPTYL